MTDPWWRRRNLLHTRCRYCVYRHERRPRAAAFVARRGGSWWRYGEPCTHLVKVGADRRRLYCCEVCAWYVVRYQKSIGERVGAYRVRRIGRR